MTTSDLKDQFGAIATARDLAQWARDMYAYGDLDECEMLRGTNLQPWDAPDTWTQLDDNGADYTISAHPDQMHLSLA